MRGIDGVGGDVALFLVLVRDGKLRAGSALG